MEMKNTFPTSYRNHERKDRSGVNFCLQNGTHDKSQATPNISPSTIVHQIQRPEQIYEVKGGERAARVDDKPDIPSSRFFC